MSSKVIIVGGGIIGIACAHYLQKSGFAVAVIDKGTIGGGCSAGNCGYICPSHVLPLTEPGAVKEGLKSLLKPGAAFRIKPRFSPALWNWLWQFARRCNHEQMLAAAVHIKALADSSMIEYRRLITEERLDCEWKTNGLLFVLKTAHGMEEFGKTHDLIRDHFNVAARKINGADLPSLDPALLPGLAGGYLYEGDASVRPDLLNASWTRRVRERGVTFIERCALRGVKSADGRLTKLVTSSGEMSADEYVFAMGAWSPQLSRELRCAIPIQPGKGYSVTMARPAPCPKYPILFPEHRVGVSPFENGYRLGSIMEFAGYDESIPDARIRQLRESARHYLVTPDVPGEEQRWFGWRPMTWDSLPIIGRVPALRNAMLATGHNMLGMTMAAGTGRLVAEMMTGEKTHIGAEAYSPARFG